MPVKPLKRAIIDSACFNSDAVLPFNLRLADFEMAMRAVYDFLQDTNQFLVNKGLPRLDDTLRAANMSDLAGGFEHLSVLSPTAEAPSRSGRYREIYAVALYIRY
jgi:hypothetical protein